MDARRRPGGTRHPALSQQHDSRSYETGPQDSRETGRERWDARETWETQDAREPQETWDAYRHDEGQHPGERPAENRAPARHRAVHRRGRPARPKSRRRWLQQLAVLMPLALASSSWALDYHPQAEDRSWFPNGYQVALGGASGSGGSGSASEGETATSETQAPAAGDETTRSEADDRAGRSTDGGAGEAGGQTGGDGSGAPAPDPDSNEPPESDPAPSNEPDPDPTASDPEPAPEPKSPAPQPKNPGPSPTATPTSTPSGPLGLPLPPLPLPLDLGLTDATNATDAALPLPLHGGLPFLSLPVDGG